MQERRLEYHGKEHHTDDERFMWDEDEYGESWVQLMNGLLRELAVLNNVEYPDGLMKHVSEIMADVKTNRNFTEQELSLVRLFNRLNDYPALQGKKLKSKNQDSNKYYETFPKENGVECGKVRYQGAPNTEEQLCHNAQDRKPHFDDTV
ncbi:Hypothetical predicted protein [Mytilus galloprovincialis]|uniref:Uncharacterized protein n=1 Tax=Mytilus galloprovincialis TaxID=29158 RepID=A0A8B6G1S3_MYTGA|nr:Hypothetical predicted protein [Mytilus galloprovincialis]